MDVLFREIIDEIQKIHPNKQTTERDLQRLLQTKLGEHGWHFQFECQLELGRSDLVYHGIVIEVKRLATVQMCEQLDRYSHNARALLIVCIRATKNLKDIFDATEVKIPCALVELKPQASMIG